MTDGNAGQHNERLHGQAQYEGLRIPPLPPAVLEPQDRDLAPVPNYYDYPLAALEGTVNTHLKESGLELKVSPPAKPFADKVDLTIMAHSVLRQPERGAKAVSGIAEELAATTAANGAVTVETVGPFINLSHNRLELAQKVLPQVIEQGPFYGFNDSGNGEPVVLDVSSPNIAKSMHLGHLRSTVIGEALSRVLYANGYKTIRDNHLGDWGTQFGILARAHELWGHEVPELQNPETQVAGLQELYVRINVAIAEEKEKNNDFSELEEAGRRWFARLEQGDPEAHTLWQWSWDLSIQEFQKVYDMLGVNFEYVLGESVYAGMNDDVYSVTQAKGIAQTDDQNRLRLIPRDPALRQLTIRKPDGSSLYSTRDIAALCARMAWFDPAKIVYVVGNEQREYFEKVFDAFSQIPSDGETPELKHVGFGPIVLPEGRMSTREGNVVFLGDVLGEAYERAHERILQNSKDFDSQLDTDALNELARQVAVGAVIYYDLKQTSDRKIVFSWDEILNFEGNSGPYLQYAHARMNALVAEAEAQELAVSEDINLERILEDAGADEIVRLLGTYPVAVKTAAEKYEPSVVSEHLYKLAHAFNVFYAKYPVLKESDPEVRANRLLLTAATRQVLKNGLDMLNIPTPDKM